MLAAAGPKAGSAAADVATLLQLTLGAVSSEGVTVRDNIRELQAQILELQVQRRQPAQKEVSTQTKEGGSPAFEALKERVEQLERLLHHGASAEDEQHPVALQMWPRGIPG